MNKIEYNAPTWKTNGKEKGKDKIPVKHDKKVEADKIIHQVLAACWVDSSSDSDDSERQGDISMVAVKDEASVFDSLFADTKTDIDNLLTLHDIQENLKDYSLSKLKSLALVLINSKDDLEKGKKDLKGASENYEEEIVKLSEQIAN